MKISKMVKSLSKKKKKSPVELFKARLKKIQPQKVIAKVGLKKKSQGLLPQVQAKMKKAMPWQKRKQSRPQAILHRLRAMAS